MELRNFLTVVVALNDLEEKIYTDILTSVGLSKPEVINRKWWNNRGSMEISWEEKKGLAKEVEQVVGDKPSVIMCERHYPIASCYNGKEIILFDNDYDADYKHSKQVFYEGQFIPEFNNETFLLFRKGKKHILGTKLKSESVNIETYPPSKVYNILDSDIPNEFFLSLEIDVYNSSVTSAHHYGHAGWRERVGRLIAHEGHLDPKTVLDLSKKLVNGRTLAGINIAGYAPILEDDKHETAALLKNYLTEVIVAYIAAKK